MVVKSISIYRSSSITKNDGFICSATLYRSDDKRDAISDGLCFIETLTVQSLSFSLFFSLRLDESDQQPQYRHSRIQKKNVDVDDFFRFVCVSAECIRRGIVPDPHPFLRIPCIRRTLVTLKEIFLFYMPLPPRIQNPGLHRIYFQNSDRHIQLYTAAVALLLL